MGKAVERKVSINSSKNINMDIRDGHANENSEADLLYSYAENLLSFGVYQYNIVSGHIQWSDGVYNILGQTKKNEPLSYQSFTSIISGKQDDQERNLKGNISSSLEYKEEFKVAFDWNTSKAIQLSGKREYDENGNVCKDTGIIRDITKEKENEVVTGNAMNELLRSNTELESFAYIASHDLQEPVRKIRTFADRLKLKLADTLGEEERMYMDRIIASTGNMRLLIDDLLDYSRTTKNNEPFEMVNLNFVLQQVKSDLELLIDETKTIIYNDKLPDVFASFSQMKQLFSNILGNSIKFRKNNNTVYVRITSSVLSEQEKEKYKLNTGIRYYKIDIEDNGIGFEQEYAQLVFQAFQRLNGKSEYPGSGIGLAICKKITEHHHGVIFAESLPGKGTHIFVILPGQNF